MEAAQCHQVMGSSSFFYYKPEPQNNSRQHGVFTPHPSTMLDNVHPQHPQRPVHSREPLIPCQPPTSYPLSLGPTTQPIYQPKAIAPVHAILTPAASPGLQDQKPAFLFSPQTQHLSLNTGCSTPDVMLYPSTPPLSISGSTGGSPPSTCGLLPTPITGSFMATENITGVKVGCEGEVANEILAGGEYARSCSPPLTPGTFSLPQNETTKFALLYRLLYHSYIHKTGAVRSFVGIHVDGVRR